MALIASLLVGVNCGGSTATVSYDPLKASAHERYERFSDLVVSYGGVSKMDEGEALSVAGNFCDNDVADMRYYIEALEGIGSLAQTLASAAALADAYCPERRVVIEGALSKLGIRDPLPG